MAFNIFNDDAIRRVHEAAARQSMAPLFRQQERQQNARFEELDGNNDGLVTRDELAKGLLGSGEASSYSLTDQLKAEQLADFALLKYDLDGDGALSVQPSVKRAERLNAQHMKGYDADCDGRVTDDELKKYVGDAMLRRVIMGGLDLDHDGAIDVGK